MAGNGLLGWVNHLATGALATDSETTAAPAANLQSDQGAIAWQTAGSLSAHVDIDAGEDVDWRLFGIFRTNLTTSASLTITLGSTQGGSDVYSPSAITGLVAGYGQIVHDAGQTYSARYCRLAVADSGNPDGFLRIGLGYAGKAFQPGKNWSFNSSFSRERNVTEVVAKGGQEYPTRNWDRRVWAIEFGIIGESEAIEDLFELDRISADGGNVMFMPRPGGTYQQRESIFGRLSGSALTFPVKTSLYRGWRGQITERL